MLKCKKLVSAVLAVAMLGAMSTTVFASGIAPRADTFTNGSFFNEYFEKDSVIDLYSTTKETTRAYFGAKMDTMKPASVYVKAAGDSSGSLDYSNYVHIINGSATPTRIGANTTQIPVGTEIHMIGWSKNNKAENYVGTVYAN